MCLRFLNNAAPRASVVLVLALACPLAGADPGVLRVCADPNNLPFSNQHGEGLENRLAELMARDMGAKLEYTWWSQRRSFIKNSLGENLCDAMMSAPTALDTVSVTRPYYRSTYVFVTRKDRDLQLTSLNDPRFEKWRVGVHVVGSDYAPPTAVLARRGLAANITGFSLFGEYGEENPPARLIHAVAAGDVDVAIVWGPFAGYFASREATSLEIAPVSPATFLTVPFTFEMSMAVRKGDEKLKTALDRALDRNCAAVRSILDRYGVPQLSPQGSPQDSRGEDKSTCGSPRSWPASWSH
jgi:mxaJ protein